MLGFILIDNTVKLRENGLDSYYTVEDERNGCAFVKYFEDKEKAIADIFSQWAGLTRREKQTSVMSVYKVSIDDVGIYDDETFEVNEYTFIMGISINDCQECIDILRDRTRKKGVYALEYAYTLYTSEELKKIVDNTFGIEENEIYLINNNRPFEIFEYDIEKLDRESIYKIQLEKTEKFSVGN